MILIFSFLFGFLEQMEGENMNKKHPFVGPFVLLVSGILISSLGGSWFWLFFVAALYGLFLTGKWLAHWGFLLVLLLPGLLGVILMDYHKSRYEETARILESAPSILIKVQHVDVLSHTENAKKVKIQAEIIAQIDSKKVQFLPNSVLEVVCPSEFLKISPRDIECGTVEPAVDNSGNQFISADSSIIETHINQWIGTTILIDGWKLSNSVFGKFPKHKLYLNSYSHWVPIPNLREPSYFQLLRHNIELVIATKVKSCLSENAWNLFLKLMLGQKGAMDPSEMRFFQKAGIVHVLSVSGMHVALIFSVLFWPLKWIRWLWLHRISWVLIMFVIWLYGSMTGMSPPVERAVWAITYSQIGQQLFKRKIWIADSYFFVGSLQLIADPLMIFDVGFQLSYAAMAGIALVVPFFNEWMLQKEWPKWKENLLAGIVISFVCSITTLPVVLYYFQQFSNWFILGNLLLIPLFTVLIYAFLGLMILACLGFFALFEELQYGCSRLFDLFLMLINKVLTFIDELPYGYSYAPSFSGTQAIMLLVFVVFWIHRIHFPHERKWTYYAIIPFLILVSL
jgi:ComEC/Rec2-related protein